MHPGTLNYRSFLYDATFWLSGPALLLGNSLRTSGDRNVPRSGPVLVLSNHQSYFDPVLVGLATRRRLCFLARDKLFRIPGFGQLITALNAIPIDQDATGLGGLRTTMKLLDEGRAVLVFPEGTRTPDGRLSPIQPGTHLLVRRTMPTIVPVGIAGAYDAWPCWRRLPRPAPLFVPALPGTIAVAVGEPMSPEPFAAMSRDRFLEELTLVMTDVHARAERLRRKAGS